ncbi:nitroreductase/quinone reductase family protein, partial [Nocardiopsis prasina]
RAARTAEIERSGRLVTVRAEELTGADRDRAWARMSEVWPNFALYQRRTDRVIPVFRLTALPEP